MNLNKCIIINPLCMLHNVPISVAKTLTKMWKKSGDSSVNGQNTFKY